MSLLKMELIPSSTVQPSLKRKLTPLRNTMQFWFALYTATPNNAQILGIADETGSIEVANVPICSFQTTIRLRISEHSASCIWLFAVVRFSKNKKSRSIQNAMKNLINFMIVEPKKYDKNR